MDIKEIASFIIAGFIVVWLLIFFIPINTFKEEMVETVEECQNRIINELPGLINDTDNLDKTLDEYCNPEKGGFARIPEFAKWLNENIIAWFFLSFFMAIAFFIIILLFGGLIALIIGIINMSNASNNQGIQWGF